MGITSRIRAYENLRIEYKTYIKHNDFDRFEELEYLGKEWEIELAKSKIRGHVLQLIEPRMENNKNRKEYHETNHQYGNKNQNIANGRQQNIPKASWVQQRYNIPQYQIPSLQRPNPYLAFQNTPQPGCPQGF